MSTPVPKVAPYMTDKRAMQYGSSVPRQQSWDSVQALTDSMHKMNVRNSPVGKAKQKPGSQSDSSSESAPVVTPVPAKDADSVNNLESAKGQQPAHLHGSQYQGAGGYQYRGMNNPLGGGKPEEVLQVDYNLQPRHFIPSGMTSSPPSINNTPVSRPTAPGTFVPPAQNLLGNNLHGSNQNAPVNPALNGFYNQPIPGAGYPGAVPGGDNKAVQDIAAQIAVANALQGLNPGATGPQQGPLNPAALAAAAAAAGYGNNPMLPNIYGNTLYAAAGGAPGAAPFYPGQENMAAAVVNAVASLPPAAFQAALQHAGLGTYPLNGVGVVNQGGPSANNRKLNLYKTELCRSWEEKGTCRYGPKCQFAHGEDELKRVQRHPKELPPGGAAPGVVEEKEITETRERAQSAGSDSEQQQTSMLARIKRNEATTPSPPTVTATPQMANGPVNGITNGRPSPAALRVDTKSLEQTVPKNSYPYTSNPAMPAPGLPIVTDVRVGRLSPVPATAGADFGRHAAARLEVVGVSPQSTQAQRPPQPGHLRSVSQNFASSAIEPNNGRASPGMAHLRSDSWGANALIAPASAIEPPAKYNERKWA
ncbi:12001_t:CDS:2 [Acaulospora colombiana]|uniref:12001_t:CDS:1 n=1 Tax=Acaulospora colombiana TaxID=27376 RepID=A0ACA9LRK8_9GLOM|nr:12001_t:CDS:2 [Acaulospora colombiana]